MATIALELFLDRRGRFPGVLWAMSFPFCFVAYNDDGSLGAPQPRPRIMCMSAVDPLSSSLLCFELAARPAQVITCCERLSMSLWLKKGRCRMWLFNSAECRNCVNRTMSPSLTSPTGSPPRGAAQFCFRRLFDKSQRGQGIGFLSISLASSVGFLSCSCPARLKLPNFRCHVPLFP